MKISNKWLIYGVISLFALAIFIGARFFANQNEDNSAEQTIIKYFEALKAGDGEELYRTERVTLGKKELKAALAESDEPGSLEYKILSTERVNKEKFIVNVDLDNTIMHYPVILIDGKWIVDVGNATQDITDWELEGLEEMEKPDLSRGIIWDDASKEQKRAH